jgi:hypothetical protein
MKTSIDNNAINTALSRYIALYAEPEARAVPSNISDKHFRRCLVIPVFNESDDFVQRLQHSALAKEALLVIIVINQPDHHLETQCNQALWDKLSQQYQCQYKDAGYCWLSIPESNMVLLVINRFDHKIPKKQGVGLARKIGADIACRLIVENRLSSHWIHHSDADTHLPDDYFSALDTFIEQSPIEQSPIEQSPLSNFSSTTYSAAIYPYQHIPVDDQTLYRATQQYERALHYYVNGLRQANSPYAYHTLGSCIASHVYHYCHARGFPKKSGGEDFYLLNKLAKLGAIAQLPNAELKIDARLSDRVPFGTGPAVEKILALNHHTEYLSYHPQCFVELGTLLKHFTTLFDYRDKSAKNTYTHYQPWLGSLSDTLQTTLIALGIPSLFAHIDKQVASKEHCTKHCHDWMDGFKTLKLIHLLEAYYPKEPLDKSAL